MKLIVMKLCGASSKMRIFHFCSNMATERGVVSGTTTSFVWILKNFRDCVEYGISNLKSSSIQINKEWITWLELSYDSYHDDSSTSSYIHLKAAVVRHPEESDISATIKVSLLNSDFFQKYAGAQRHKFTTSMEYVDFLEFITIADVLDEDKKVLVNGDLIVFFEINLEEELPEVRRQDRNISNKCLLAENLDSLLKTSCFSDFVVKVKDKRFPCHKFMLASRSTFFSKMFEQGAKTNDDKLIIFGVKPRLFEKILSYIYTGDAEMSEQDALDLMPMAVSFGLKDLVTVCGDKLHSCLCVENAREMQNFACSYNVEKLRASAFRVLECLDKKNTMLGSSARKGSFFDWEPGTLSSKIFDGQVKRILSFSFQSGKKKRQSEKEKLLFGSTSLMVHGENTKAFSLTEADIWCRGDRLILAQCEWKLENLSEYLKNPDSPIIPYLVSSNDGTFAVKINSTFEAHRKYCTLRLHVHATSSTKKHSKFCMTFKIQVGNKDGRVSFCHRQTYPVSFQQDNTAEFSIKINVPSTMEEMYDSECRMHFTFTVDKSALYECMYPSASVIAMQNLEDDMLSLLTNNRLTDAVIKIEGESIRCHKAMLAHHAPYFASKFGHGGFPEEEMQIDDIKPHIFKRILHCIYSGKCDFTEPEIAELVPIINKYKLFNITSSL